jgi:Holliday junction resolvase
VTHYRNGRAAEYRVRDLLRDRGYFVLRSAGSGTPVDLVALKNGETRLIQVKRSDSCGPGEWNQLYDLAAAVGAVPMLAVAAPRKPVDLYVLAGRKDGSGTRQPREVFTP